MAHPEFPPIAFICAALLLLPLPWHWKARNIATLSIIFWLFVMNVIIGVDALVWAENVRVVVPVWCDITTKMLVGSNFALPAACLCLSIHLEQVASVRKAHSGPSDKKKRMIFEGVMCFGVPLLFMALHYIVQGHRFNIIEDFGCRPTIYFSVSSLILVYLPPMMLAAGSLIFSALALRHFVIRRLTFAAHLQVSNSGFTTSRYLRLMAMSSIQMIWSLIFASYSLGYELSTHHLLPWTTWADVHSDWLRIDKFPKTTFAGTTPTFVDTGYTLLWWASPASTIIFVAFFAFGSDAVSEYKKAFRWATSCLPSRFTRSRLSTDGGKKLASSCPSTPMKSSTDQYWPTAITYSPSSSSSKYLPQTPRTPPPGYDLPRSLSPASHDTPRTSAANKFTLPLPFHNRLPKHEQSFETTPSFTSRGAASLTDPFASQATATLTTITSLTPPPRSRTPTPEPLRLPSHAAMASAFDSDAVAFPPTATFGSGSGSQTSFGIPEEDHTSKFTPPPSPRRPRPARSTSGDLKTPPISPRPLTYPSFDASNAHRGSVVPSEWMQFSEVSCAGKESV